MYLHTDHFEQKVFMGRPDENVIRWKHFPHYWPSVRGKANDAELWCFPWSELEQTMEQTITPVILGAIAYIMMSL